MELDVWKGDWGLASVDFQCLRTYAYVKFLGAPVKFQEKWNPFYTPSGSFPVFRSGKRVCTHFEEITEYLKCQNLDADSHLSRDQLFTAWACTKYLENNLYPCLQQIWWGDTPDSGQQFKMWFMKNITFPFNYYYAGVYQERAQATIDLLLGSGSGSGSGEDVKEVYLNVYRLAEKCFNDLSARLGDGPFFFGSRPSSLDATVFAYLALILKVPQKNATLVNKLKTYDKLVQFAVRISQRYFTSGHTEFVSGVTRMVSSATSKTEAVQASLKYREKVYAGLFALVAMTCFAFSKGIIQLNLREQYHHHHDAYIDLYDLAEEEGEEEDT